MMKITVKAFLMCLLLASMSSLAKADGIDFAGTTGGSLSFTPQVGNSLSVTNAPVNSLWALSGPSTQYYLSPTINGATTGALNFTTGAATQIFTSDISKPNYNPFCPGTCAVFGPGGSPSNPDLTITGNVYKYDSSNNATLIASGTLLTGAFVSGNATFGSNGLGNLGGLFNVSSLNPSLTAALFGLVPEGPSAGSIGQVLFNIQLTNGSYSGTVGSTNLIATIPEPAGLLLLGSGLLVGAGFLRKTLEKNQKKSRSGLL